MFLKKDQKFRNETDMANAKREYDLRKAANQKEVETQMAIEKLGQFIDDSKKIENLYDFEA